MSARRGLRGTVWSELEPNHGALLRDVVVLTKPEARRHLDLPGQPQPGHPGRYAAPPTGGPLKITDAVR